MLTCFFCDQLFQDVEELASHLVYRHASEKVGRHALFVWSGHRLVSCWCSREHAFLYASEHGEVSEWARHLEERGGLEAHILEILLK